jgi:hypothetical protein
MNGPTKDSHWNVIIRYRDFSKSDAWFAANLYAAAHAFARYYPIWGVHNPYNAGGFNLVNIRMHEGDNRSGGRMSAWDGNNITMWVYGGGYPVPTPNIYATLFHEMGHQSHWKNNKGMMFFNKLIRESWAECVMWYTLPTFYPNFPSVSRNPAIGTDNPQFMLYSNGNIRKGYTALFIDLMDHNNQLISEGGDRPDDVLSQFTFFEVQKIAKNCRNVSKVKEYIISNYSNKITNVDSDRFDAFFAWYQRVEDNLNN